MCNIPFVIADDEKIARAIKTPYHIKKKTKKLRPAAFRPPPKRDDLSVMRLTYMGTNACKAKAKQIAGCKYLGLAAIDAAEIRSAGAAVQDSRGQFCGHADIVQGIPAPATEIGETAPPWLLERYKTLADMARLYIDPDPDKKQWTGKTIT